jgi:flagellar basal body-associated protein FliL
MNKRTRAVALILVVVMVIALLASMVAPYLLY